jgi:hypothetical protein
MFHRAARTRVHPGFDLVAIEASLRRTQAGFGTINRSLRVPRDPLDSEVIANLIEAYAYVDALIRDDINMFALGSLRCLLEINRLVLCGSSEARRRRYASHLEATELRFYEEREGGVGDLVEWVEDHARDPVWERAAGVYIRILSKPQLYVEGNHRSGALVISYVLGREGLPPFVLSPENARTYFDPSSLITDTSKKSLSMMFRMPAVRKRFAVFLQEQSNSGFLAANAALKVTSRA